MTIQPIDTTLFHKIIPPRIQENEKHPCLILLHGRGADENDLLGLSEYLDPRLLIISVRAPLPFDYGFGYTWYQMLENYQPELMSLKESFQKLKQFITDVAEKYPVDPSKIFVLGFSMGTVMGNLLLLSHPEKIAGLIANSGYLPVNSGFSYDYSAIKEKPIFIAHGTEDLIIPIRFGQHMYNEFKKAESNVIYKEYPMGHEISMESLRDMSDWLTKYLNTK